MNTSLPIDELSWRTARLCLRLSTWMLGPLYVLVTLSLYAAFLYAPTEAEMGDVQRIFYFHVGAAWNAFLAFFGVFAGGLAYLLTRKRIWDELAVSCCEVGLVFTTIVLITGSIWAKPVWNTWWAWGDPRLMTTMVLWFIYVAYLMLRSSLPPGEKRSRYCAVFGIIGFLDVPIVWVSIRLWRTIHPVVITSSGAELDPRMVHALLVSVLTFTVLGTVLVSLRAASRLHMAAGDSIHQYLLDKKGAI